MKKTEVLAKISSYLDACEELGDLPKASHILDLVLRQGMVPVTQQSVVWSHPAVIYKFEEDISPQEWEFASRNAKRYED